MYSSALISKMVMRSGPDPDLDDLIACFDLAFLQHTQIETGPAARDQQRGHLRLVHADADPITSDARLRHFEQGAADPVTVANAHLPIRQALDRKILPELSIAEVVAAELALPKAIGVHLINENGAVLAAVPEQVSLPIAIDVEPAYHARALNRCFPDGGVDGLALPWNVARQAHIDRQQASHRFTP